MSLVSLQNSSEQEVTILSNRFIDPFFSTTTPPTVLII